MLTQYYEAGSELLNSVMVHLHVVLVIMWCQLYVFLFVFKYEDSEDGIVPKAFSLI